MPVLPGITDVHELGGILKNYGEVEDPETDLDADSDNKNRACTAAASHTVARALVSFVGHATAPADPPSGFVHDAVWGSAIAVKPQITKVGGGGSGRYNASFPASVVDELGVSHTVSFRRAKAAAEGSTAFHCQAEISAANVIHVRVFDMAGAPADAAGAVITVEAV